MYSPSGLVTVKNAGAVLAQARALGLDIPEAITEAETFRAEVERLTATPPPVRPPLPEHAEQLAALVSQHAADMRAHDLTKQAAKGYATDAARMYIDAVRAAVPAWINTMVELYLKQIATFRAVIPRVPADATPERLGVLSPTQFRNWQTCDRAAWMLDALVTARRDMDRITTAPPGQFGEVAAAAVVTTVPRGAECRTTWQALSDGVRTWREREHDQVARWRALTEAADTARLDLCLAKPGTLAHRAAGYRAWQEHMLNPGLRKVLT